jgi:cytochrome c553
MRLRRGISYGLLAAVGLIILADCSMASAGSAPRFVLACASCHGFDGMGNNANIPNLAGQHRDYLRAQLLAFRTGQREHPLMNFFAGQVDPDEVDELVDYYAGLPKQD